jgi:hypothetical protein
MPTSKVRRPILENFVNYSSKFKLLSFASLALTILSAPFMYIFKTPFDFIMTDILFLSEVNGKSSSSSNVFYTPLILIVVED